jgi:hypothetical protein
MKGSMMGRGCLLQVEKGVKMESDERKMVTRGCLLHSGSKKD